MSVFAHVVDAGSITAAAETLNVSKSVVSQHLKSLEQELKVSLLKRTTRRQMLTSAGESFYEQCKKLNDVAEIAWTQAQNTLQEPQGKVRITAPNALMGTLIAPAIAQLLKSYPELKPELISSDKKLNLFEEDIDLAIRVGPSPESNLKQRRIGEFRDLLCMNRSYLNDQQHHAHAYVANDWQGKQITHQFKHKQTGKLFSFSANVHCQADSFHTCLSLIESGAGIGLIPDFLFRAKSNDLIEVFPNYQLSLNSIFALHPFNRQLPLSVSECLKSIESYIKRTTTM